MIITRCIIQLHSSRYKCIRSYHGVMLGCNPNANRYIASYRTPSTSTRSSKDSIDFICTRALSTRERIPSRKSQMKEIIKDQFDFSKQGLRYRTEEMDGKIEGVDREKISSLYVYFDESFAQTLYDITITIKRKLEATFSVMQAPDLITPEEYTDPTTKKLPLYLQPRSIESLMEGICIFYGSTALTPEKIPDNELKDFYRKIVLRMEESGFIHPDAKLSEENTAHPHDFYFSLQMTPHNRQQLQTFPNTTHHLLIANIQASVGMYKLYDDLQIAANHTPSLRYTIAHRNNGALRRSRRPVWVPQIVLGTIVNGMDGCKKEERTLRNICKDLNVQESFETLNFYPKGIRMQGYIPTLPYHPKANNEMNWDFSFEQCRNAKRPKFNTDEWEDEEWWLREIDNE